MLTLVGGPSSRRSNWLLPVLAIVVFVIGVVSPSVQVTDSRLTVATATSLLNEGNLDLDEFEEVDRLGRPYDVVVVDGHRLWYFPWPIVLLAVPAVATAQVLGVNTGELRPSNTNQTWLLEIPVASALVSITTVTVFLLALHLLPFEHRRRRGLAAVVAIVFFLGTPAWSTATRALWGHTASFVFVALSVLLAVRGRGDERFIPPIGATIALAYAMRPTNAISVVAFSGWVLACHRRQLVAYLAFAALVAIPFITVNMLAYNSPLAPYFSAGRLGMTGTLWEGLAGTVISPSRGLLWYVPVVLLVPVGVAAQLRRRCFDGLDTALLAILLLHWLLIALWSDWWGGSAYGPRFFTDVLPILAYFAIIGLGTLLQINHHRRTVLKGATALALLSILVNAQGAMLRANFCWNATPVLIQQQPNRVWDWNDPQMLRAVRDLANHKSPATVVAGVCSN